MQDCHEYEEELESELKAYRKIADEVKLSELSTKMRQDAKLRQQASTPRSIVPEGKWRASFWRTSAT